MVFVKIHQTEVARAAVLKRHSMNQVASRAVQCFIDFNGFAVIGSNSVNYKSNELGNGQRTPFSKISARRLETLSKPPRTNSD